MTSSDAATTEVVKTPFHRHQPDGWLRADQIEAHCTRTHTSKLPPPCGVCSRNQGVQSSGSQKFAARESGRERQGEWTAHARVGDLPMSVSELAIATMRFPQDKVPRPDFCRRT